MGGNWRMRLTGLERLKRKRRRRQIRIRSPTNLRKGRRRNPARKKRKKGEQKRKRKKLQRSWREKLQRRIRREMRAPRSPERGETNRAKGEAPGSRKGRTQMRERQKDH